MDLIETPAALGRSVSSLDLEVFRSTPSPFLSDQEDSFTMEERDQCDQEGILLRQQGRRVNRQMSEFLVEHINTSRIKVVEPELAGIKVMKDDYQDTIELYLDRFSHIMTVNTRESWRREVTAIGPAVISHADRIRTRAAQVTAVANSNANSVRTLEIQEETLKLQELSINNAKQTSE